MILKYIKLFEKFSENNTLYDNIGDSYYFSITDSIKDGLIDIYMVIQSETDGTIIGSIDIDNSSDISESLLFIRTVEIEEEYRNRGLYTEILRTVSNYIKSNFPNIEFLVSEKYPINGDNRTDLADGFWDKMYNKTNHGLNIIKKDNDYYLVIR